MARVWDIFSMLPEKQMSTEKIESIFMEIDAGNTVGGFSLEYDVPKGMQENVISCANDLKGQGKSVALLFKDSEYIAMIGYKE